MPMINYLILVPMDEEFQCARQVWRHVQPNDGVRIGAFDYYRFLHRTPHGEALVVIAPMGSMGLTWSGLFATKAIQTWKPANVILIGIAGSLVGRKLPLGDVIIPDQVVGYQLGDIIEKEGSFHYDFRREAVPVSFHLLADARELAREDQRGWALRSVEASFEDNKAKGISLGTPSLHIGEKEILASGNFVVKSKKYADAVRALDTQIRAVEMEAMGIFDALRPLKDAPIALVVRGISDYADPDKELQDEASGGNFRRSAMRSATQLVLDLVDRRLRRGQLDQVQSLAFQPRKTQFPRETVIGHGLTPMGEGSRYIVYDSLLEVTDAMTEIVQLIVRAKGKQASRNRAQVALKQKRKGWQRILKPVGDNGVWTCSIERSEEPYSLSLAVVAEDPALTFEIVAKDEFGRETSALALEADR
jgi:nucleoside phosphorylase